MITKIDGSCFIDLVHGGLKNLEKHRNALNELNVFPVPDGDTGTNMVMTVRYGYEAIKGQSGSLSDLALRFSSSAVFGARGNSGVIVSQFFKGLSEKFRGAESADCELFASALQNGCDYAYASVAHPVEGTMLTVLKDASRAVTRALPLQGINAAVDIFLGEARVSLLHTPELLPILKKARVVDSGGSGIVYFFEGVKKFLNGESIDSTEDGESCEAIDFSIFNKDTKFDFGYCTEGLIQLKKDLDEDDFEDFKEDLEDYGDSVVASLMDDKIKIHIHTKRLGKLMDFCQKYGEFLTVKIENMSVQNLQNAKKQKDAPKFLYREDFGDHSFGVVAVATNPYMQKRFFDMGADVVILSEIAPSSQDFLEAFSHIPAEKILVFPNSANSILASVQAGSLYRGAKIEVLNCRSIAECHAVLSVLDYDCSIDAAVSQSNDVLSGIYQVSVYHAVKDVKFGNKTIDKNDFFSLANNNIIAVSDTLETAVIRTVDSVLKERDADVVTLFYGAYISPEFVDRLAEKIGKNRCEIEIATVSTLETVYDITVTFE